MDFLFSIVIGFILGLVFYAYDRKKGPKLYKFWYDLTHGEKLKELPAHGMVHLRPMRNKITYAMALGVKWGILMFIIGMGHPLTAVLSVIAAFMGSAIAFATAPLVFRIDRSQMEALLKKVDDLEAREHPRPKPEPKPQPEPPKQASPPNTDSSDDDPKKGGDDWRKGVRNFLDD